MMKSAIVLVLTAILGLSAQVAAAPSLYAIELTDIEGKPTSLAAHKGKVMLIVNVASKCGYTRQYAGLEKLYDQYKDKGVVVLGFPCNQFGNQEPGSEEQIQEFCRLTYGVSFPMFSKIEVNGDNKHPLYQHLTGEHSPFPGRITWNFNKFLIGPDGAIAKRYGSDVEPLSEELIADIEALLGATS